MALTKEKLAPWHRWIACFEEGIGRPSYITLQDGWPFGYWFMGNDRRMWGCRSSPVALPGGDAARAAGEAHCPPSAPT
jgi:hypothetical protein